MPISAIALLVIAPFSGRPFVRFHALQAVFTFGAMFALTVAMRVMLGLFFLVPLLGRMLAVLVLMGMWVGFLALWIWLMAQALQGNRYKLPFLGDYAERQAGR